MPSSSPSPSAPAFDPRDEVTEYAFQVDPALLGTPLARPWRRAAAMGVDLGFAAIIANVAGGLVGFVVAFVFFRVATRKQVDHRLKRWIRATFAFLGALIVFGTSVALLEGGDDADDETGPPMTLSTPLPGVSESDSGPAADRVQQADRVHQQVARTLAELDTLPGVNRAMLRRALRTAEHPMPDDSLSRVEAVAALRQYADALAAGDSAAVDTLHDAAAQAAAGARLEALRTEVDRLDDERDRLDDRVDDLEEQVNEPSFLYLLRAFANDLGITFGWIGLYFTLFLAWWDGQTPGKRMFGLQVVRLDGEPLGLWFCLERFGGYAAGIFTGLFGFAQVYWDPNRQAIHDRIARTVVIQRP